MNRAWILGAGVAALVAGVYALNAQVVPQPGPPVAIACAFNTVPPTLTTGQAGWVQCDNAGQLLVSGGGGGGGSVTQGTSPWVDNITQWASTALGAPSAYGTSPGAVNVPGMNAYVTNATAPGQAAMAASSPVVIASNQQVADPCMFQAKTNLSINQNGTSSVQLIALSGSTSIYVCSIALVTNSTATTVALTTGTGSACVTGNAAVLGSTTANIANSINLIAGAGLTYGNGQGTIAKGAASSELCMILGSNVFVSGNLTYVQQ